VRDPKTFIHVAARSPSGHCCHAQTKYLQRNAGDPRKRIQGLSGLRRPTPWLVAEGEQQQRLPIRSFWIAPETQLPHLTKLARWIAGRPVSSTSIERVFSPAVFIPKLYLPCGLSVTCMSSCMPASQLCNFILNACLHVTCPVSMKPRVLSHEITERGWAGRRAIPELALSTRDATSTG
jgi:hypothetical protein